MGIETALIVGATALSAGSSILGGRAAKKAAYADGEAELAAAKQEAMTIRRAGKKARSQAGAYYAASGVDVADGTPTVVDRQISQDSEQDALTTILTGERRRRSLRDQGVSAERQGYFQAASTALNAGASLAKGGWK